MNQNKYWGSVLFFKHLLVTVALLIVLTPVALCVVLGSKVSALQAQVQELTAAAPPAVSRMPAASPTAVIEAEHPAYEALYPDLYVRDVAYNSIDTPKTVYLTFDDGPSKMTPKVLDILKQYGVKATFFTTAQNPGELAYMKRAADEGHTVGIHSYSHDYETIYASVEAFLEDFKKQYDLVYQQTGVYPQVFRFPGGSINAYNKTLYLECIAEMTRRGFTYYDWNASLQDASSSVTAQAMLENGVQNISHLRRSILLMHDGASNQYIDDVLPDLIQAYQAAGFQFERLTPEVRPVQFSYMNTPAQ